MTTLEHRAPEMTATEPAPARPISDYWMAALKFYATGRTSRALRVMAADEQMTRGLALMSGVTVDEERAQMEGIASAIDALTDAGLTPEQAYGLAGLGDLFGVPFAEFDPDANWYAVPAPRKAAAA